MEVHAIGKVRQEIVCAPVNAVFGRMQRRVERDVAVAPLAACFVGRADAPEFGAGGLGGPGECTAGSCLAGADGDVVLGELAEDGVSVDG